MRSRWLPGLERRSRSRIAEREPCVYNVCMARVNVYLPDDLAERARSAGVNVSGVAQDAIRGALASIETDVWLERLERFAHTDVAHDTVISAIDEARDEFGD
jgi:post-segregation antitoxin (ccd killing protein)